MVLIIAWLNGLLGVTYGRCDDAHYCSLLLHIPGIISEEPSIQLVERIP